MGLYALFCTQSNDVAIGLPIVTAIYPVATYPANYPGYLIILSTLQVCAVNPLCIALLEWGKSESSPPVEGEPRRSIGLTVLRTHFPPSITPICRFSEGSQQVL